MILMINYPITDAFLIVQQQLYSRSHRPSLHGWITTTKAPVGYYKPMYGGPYLMINTSVL